MQPLTDETHTSPVPPRCHAAYAGSLHPPEEPAQPWPTWAYQVARQLGTSGAFRAHLCPSEYPEFLQSAETSSRWADLLDGAAVGCDCPRPCGAAESIPDTPYGNHDLKLGPANSCPRAITAFRTRRMLFEQMIPFLFPSNCDCTPNPINPFTDSQLQRLMFPGNPEPTSSSDLASDAFVADHTTALAEKLSQSSLLSTMLASTASSSTLMAPVHKPTEDDDYDDEDDYDNDPVSASQVSLAKTAATISPPVDPRPLPPTHVPADASEGAATSPSPTDWLAEDFTLPFNAVYHTLEDDSEATEDYLTQLEKDQQTVVDDLAIKDEADSAVGGSGTKAQTRPTETFHDRVIESMSRSNPHLKHLFHAIDHQRKHLPVSDRELRHLLSDLRTHRSKWASDDRVGQEELYEALERVLHDLKNYTPHSIPFTTKVSRRDAPDYYDVITEPMDLGTMTKKLKGLQYPDKASFAYDISLIVANCLYYNSDPASVFRKHATAFRRKADALLKTVPDLVIRNRAEVEAEESVMDVDGDRDDISESERSFYTSQHNGHVPEVSTPGSMTTSRLGPPLGGDGQDMSASSTPRPGRRNTLLSNGSVSVGIPPMGEADELSQLDEEEPGAPVDPQDLVWQAKTALYRAQHQSQANQVQRQPFPDRAGLARTPEGMAQFAQGDHTLYERVRWCGPVLENASAPDDSASTHHSWPKAGAMVETVGAGSLRLRSQRSLWSSPKPPAIAGVGLAWDSTLSGAGKVNQWMSAMAKASATSLHPPDGPLLVAGQRAFVPLPGGHFPTPLSVPSCLVEYGTATGMPMPRAGPTVADATSLGPNHPLADPVPLHRYPAVLIPTRSKLPSLVFANLQHYHEIREIDTKIWTSKMNLPIGVGQPLNDAIPGEDDKVNTIIRRLVPEFGFESPFNYPGAGNKVVQSQAPPTWLTRRHQRGPLMASASARAFSTLADQSDLAEEEQALPPLQLNQDTAYELMSRVASLLVTHVGFEDLHEMALCVITDLTINCLMNLGKTLRCYCDKYGRRMEPAEILAHVLFDNGVESLQTLRHYIRDDIERYGPRLADLKRKLDNAYLRELDRTSDEEEVSEYSMYSSSEESETEKAPPGSADDSREDHGGPAKRLSTLPAKEGDDINFDESANAFMIGDFGDSLGTDDFLGFKSLGLDEEYGVDTLRLPSQLLFGKYYHGQAVGTRKKRKRRQNKWPYRPPKLEWAPITAETAPKQIGLLSGFYEKKLLAAESTTVVEDEALPPRQRYNAHKPRQPTFVKRPLLALYGNQAVSSKGGKLPGQAKSKSKPPVSQK